MKAKTGFEPVNPNSPGTGGKPAGEADYGNPGLFEALYGILFQPPPAIKKIVSAEPVSLAVFISFLASLMIFTPQIADRAVLYPDPAPVMLLAFLAAVANLLLLFIGALFFTLFARFLGGDSNYFGFFAAAGISQFVFFLYPVAVFISRLAGLPAYLGIFLRTVLLAWYYLLFLLSLRESQNFSSFRAVLTVVGTVAACAALVFLLGAGALALVFSL